MTRITVAIFALITLGLLGCNPVKKGGAVKKDFSVQLEEIVIESVTVQERLTGVEGGKNSIEFMLYLDITSVEITADSLKGNGFKCAVFKKGMDSNVYTGRVNKDEQMDFKSDMILELKNSSLTIPIPKEKIKILPSIALP